jgi:hypothetical protein
LPKSCCGFAKDLRRFYPKAAQVSGKSCAAFLILATNRDFITLVGEGKWSKLFLLKSRTAELPEEA